MESVPHTPFMIVIRSARRKLLQESASVFGGGRKGKGGDIPDEGKVAVVIPVLVEGPLLLLRHIRLLALLGRHRGGGGGGGMQKHKWQ